MPKSEYPSNVQALPKDKYDKWTSVYKSARDDGKSKESAAKIAWSQVNEQKQNKREGTMKITKKQLKEMIKRETKRQLKEGRSYVVERNDIADEFASMALEELAAEDVDVNADADGRDYATVKHVMSQAVDEAFNLGVTAGRKQASREMP